MVILKEAKKPMHEGERKAGSFVVNYWGVKVEYVIYERPDGTRYCVGIDVRQAAIKLGAMATKNFMAVQGHAENIGTIKNAIPPFGSTKEPFLPLGTYK
jgi:hypothetical protein